MVAGAMEIVCAAAGSSAHIANANAANATLAISLTFNLRFMLRSLIPVLLLVFSETIAVRPKSQSWIPDEESLFAFNRVVALGKFFWIVAFKHFTKIAIAEANTLNLLAGEVAGAPGNGEAPFRGAV